MFVFHSVGIVIPIGQGLVGHCAKTGQVINTSAADKSPLHFKDEDKKLGFQTNSLLAAPVFKTPQDRDKVRFGAIRKGWGGGVVGGTVV